ncbi:MAG: glycosyltransferase family 39 protein, partial [Verrucomicrobia bacterium]|nr:glycosyltransferase family 39 protein [Verrucomicrobiota bacterium]
TPSAIRVPAFPLALVAFYRIFGVSRITVVLFQSLMDTLTGLLMAGLAYRLGLSRRATVFGLLVWAVYFPHLYYTNVAMSEPFFTAWLMLALWFLARRPGPSMPEMVGSSAALAVAALTRSVVLLFLPAVLALRWHDRWRGDLKRRVTYALVFCAVLAPWALRNHARFGSFVWSTTLGGLTAYITVYRIAEPDYVTSWHVNCAEGVSALETELRARGMDPAQMNEVECDRWARKLVREKVQAHPFRFIRLGIESFMRTMFCVYNFGFHSWRNAAVFGLNTFIYGLAILGFVKRVRAAGAWDRRWVLLILLVAINTAGYSVVGGMSRYNNPMIPIFLLAAGAGLTALTARSAAREGR